MTSVSRFSFLVFTMLTGVVAAGLPGHAQSDLTTAARADLGKKIATLWCSECHLVEPNDTVAVQSDVPSFAEISNREGQSEMRIMKFMLDPHPSMPKLDLSRDDQQNLVTFILSLKTRD